MLYQPCGAFSDFRKKRCTTCETSHSLVDYGYNGSSNFFPRVTVNDQLAVKYGMIIRYDGTVDIDPMTVSSARYVGLARYRIPLNCR